MSPTAIPALRTYLYGAALKCGERAEKIRKEGTL